MTVNIYHTGMMMRPVDFHTIRNLIMIAFCVYIPTTFAQTADTTSGAINIITDTDSVKIGIIDDTTVNTAKVKDRNKDDKDIDAINLDDEELLRAALTADSVRITPSTQKLELIRREYEYKQQTRAAIVMMIFIAVAMATSQSWNPR